jgi:hypothetical protein
VRPGGTHEVLSSHGIVESLPQGGRVLVGTEVRTIDGHDGRAAGEGDALEQQGRTGAADGEDRISARV